VFGTLVGVVLSGVLVARFAFARQSVAEPSAEPALESPVSGPLLAWSVAFGVLALAAVLLSPPTAGIIGNIIQVFDPIAYVSSLLLILVACLLAASIATWRAARVDPMRSLRQD
jgi:ABC-type lipoprotein release transport system permease subunit